MSFSGSRLPVTDGGLGVGRRTCRFGELPG